MDWPTGPVTVICDTDGVLTDGTVYVDADGRETLRFHKRDGWLLREADAAGIAVVVCTQDPNPGPSRERAVKIGLVHVALHDADGKERLVREYQGRGQAVVYIGDSPQDIPAMIAADVAVCPADADLRRAGGRWYEAHWSVAGHVVRVAMVNGGGGVLYEVLRMMLDARGAK